MGGSQKILDASTLIVKVIFFIAICSHLVVVYQQPSRYLHALKKLHEFRFPNNGVKRKFRDIAPLGVLE